MNTQFVQDSNQRFLSWLYQVNPSLVTIQEQNGIFTYQGQEIDLKEVNLQTILKNGTLHEAIETITASDLFRIFSIYANMSTFEKALPYYQQLLAQKGELTSDDQKLIYFMHGCVSNYLEFEDYLNEEVEQAFKGCLAYYIDLELSDENLTKLQKNALFTWREKQDELDSKRRDKSHNQDKVKRLVLSKDNKGGSVLTILIVILTVSIGIALGSILFLIY